MFKPGVFTDGHVPMLVFQEATLKRIRRDYAITNKDFIILSGGYLIQKANLLDYFDNPDIQKLVMGVGRHQVYKSIKRLLKRGLILVKEVRKRQRRFQITDKGYSAIKAYTAGFNFIACQYLEKVNPRLREEGLGMLRTWQS